MFKGLFNTSAFGLDISDESLKFVELIDIKNGMQIGRYGEHKLSPGIIEGGEIKNPKKLEQILSSLKKTFGLKSVHVSLLNKNIQNIQKHVSVLKNSGIKIKSFEPHAEALARSLVKKGDYGTYMIVDFGKKHSTIIVVSGGVVVFGLTRASNTASLLQEEVAKNFLHWHTYKTAEEIRLPIKKIVVSGNQPNIAEFAEYLAVHMRHAVEVGNVWTNIIDTKKHVLTMHFEESLGFATALGLVLKDFMIDPSL